MDKVLTGDGPFEETVTHPSRYEKILEVEDQYVDKNLADTSIREAAQSTLLKIIQDNRKNHDTVTAAK
jgi:hypothetical protein